MTLSVSISIPGLIARLSEDEQARFFDAAIAGRPIDADIRERLKQLDQEAQVTAG